MTSRVWVGALLGAVTFGFGVTVAAAQDAPTQEQPKLPQPPDGWWEQVKGGESATYDMTQMGMQMKMKMTVDKVEGSKITFTAAVEMPGAPPGSIPPQKETIDFGDKAQVEQKQKMPKDATVKQVGEETVNAAGRDWPCTVWEVEGSERGQKMKMKIWHSAELLPVFSNGTVKMEVEMMGPNGQPMKVEMVLTEVKGPGEGGAAPQDAPPPGKGQ